MKFRKVLIALHLVSVLSFSLISNAFAAERNDTNFHPTTHKKHTLTGKQAADWLQKHEKSVKKKGITIVLHKSDTQSISVGAKPGTENKSQPKVDLTQPLHFSKEQIKGALSGTSTVSTALSSNLVPDASSNATADDVSYVHMSYFYSFNDDSTISMGFVVDEITGDAPGYISWDFAPHNGTTADTQEYYDSIAGDLESVYVGATVVEDFEVDDTHFWSGTYYLEAFTSEGVPYPDYPYANAYFGLANRYAVEYPGPYVDYLSGQVNSEPTYSDYLPADNPVTWTSTDRQNYITWYTNQYGTPSGGWSNYDIHHILPRKYGGTNDYSNLIPLPRSYHQQTVTPWWAGYSMSSYSDVTSWGDD